MVQIYCSLDPLCFFHTAAASLKCSTKQQGLLKLSSSSKAVLVPATECFHA